jgi:hypothetical protein
MNHVSDDGAALRLYQPLWLSLLQSPFFDICEDKTREDYGSRLRIHHKELGKGKRTTLKTARVHQNLPVPKPSGKKRRGRKATCWSKRRYGKKVKRGNIN